jgi:hypothetical protein
MSRYLTAVAILSALAQTSARAQAPPPSITSMNPNVQTSGSPGFRLDLTGTNFCPDLVNGAPGTFLTFNGNIVFDFSATTTTASFNIPGNYIPSVSSTTQVAVTITTSGQCPTIPAQTSSPVSFTINPPLTVSPVTLPNGSVGSPYVQTISAAGGTLPYSTPPIPQGAPPRGTTASAGTFSINFTPGPNDPTTYRWILNQTDSGGGSVSQLYSFTVSTPSSATAGPGTTPQSATVRTTFATALQVLVIDAAGAPVQGAQVTFSAPTSGPSGTFANSPIAIVFTDATGNATAPFRANTIAGSYTVNATTPGVAGAVSFNLTNRAGFPTRITATAGTPQSATILTAFQTALQVTVTDSYGNPVSGLLVRYSAPTSGASGAFSGSPTATVTTNASGIATAPTFTANSTAGSYTVPVQLPQVDALPPVFQLTNNPGAPSTITATAGTPQSTAVNTAFSTALLATVKDVAAISCPTPR